MAANLGYLPGSSVAEGGGTPARLATQADTTVAALAAAAEHVAIGGGMVLLCYLRHQGGTEEHAAVRSFVAGLPPAEWRTVELELVNRDRAPRMIALMRVA